MKLRYPLLASRSNRWAALAALMIAGSGCGGGTEIAPPAPVVEGTGTATATLDQVSLGATQLVESLVSGERSQLVDVVAESVTFVGDVATLAHGSLPPVSSVAVTDVGGGVSYQQNVDYNVNFNAGVLTLTPTSAIAPGATVEVTYRYTRRLLTLAVGITFAAGHSVSLTIFNLDEEGGGPIRVVPVASSAPTDNSVAFDGRVQTDLTSSVGQGDYLVVADCSTSMDPVTCPQPNELVIDSYDLTNELNPCIAGTARVTLVNANDSDPTNRAVLQVSFSDPDC